MDEDLTHIFKKEPVRPGLGTEIIGQKIYSYDMVTSTNDLAHYLARNGEPEGAVIFAKGQTQGRGRLGNSWVSPYDQGLYFSFVLRPQISAAMAPRVTLMVALAVAVALRDIHIEGVAIKWPNDVLIKEKKICGILTEMHLEAERVDYLVIGVGLNVNASGLALPQGATSLKEEANRTFDIADLSHIIIKRLDHYYDFLRKGRFADILAEVKGFSALILGGRVRVEWQDKAVEGYVVDFDEDGALIVRKDNGLSERILTGHLIRLD
ncbi:MAG: biotin--[acetyl-CoA-carboxylase] ligase [Candidatus Omnitrophota bacterium]